MYESYTVLMGPDMAGVQEVGIRCYILPVKGATRYNLCVRFSPAFLVPTHLTAFVVSIVRHILRQSNHKDVTQLCRSLERFADALKPIERYYIEPTNSKHLGIPNTSRVDIYGVTDRHAPMLAELTADMENVDEVCIR